MPGDRVRGHGELSRGKDISAENRKRIVTLGEEMAHGGPEQRRACHGEEAADLSPMGLL